MNNDLWVISVFICKKNIIFIILIVFFSCDKDGTIVVNPIQPEAPFVNDLSGNGCSGDNLCYSVDDIYYNFSGSNPFEIDYYKFNSYQLQSGNHNANDPANVLELTSFNETYFIGIPAASIADESNQVIVGDDESGENYVFTEQEIISHTLLSEQILDTTAQISLSSNPFSIIKNVTWNKQQGRYNFVTETSDKNDANFLYSQNYKDNIYSTLIDTALNPIFGDFILVDEDEYVYRHYTIIDSIDNNEVRSTRRSQFKIKSTFIPDEDALMFKQSTDCNDNYRQDEEEIVLFDKYFMADSNYASSFEGQCFAGACSNDNSSYNIEDCCENNGGMWYSNTMTCEPFCLNYSIDCSIYENSNDCANSSKCSWNAGSDVCISNITEQDCCNNTWGENYAWDIESAQCLELIEDEQEDNNVIDNWSSRPDEFSWNDSFAVFNVNTEDLCSTTCTNLATNNLQNMHDFCWDTYSSDHRATATCQIDNTNSMLNSQTGEQYFMTFCDVGNNLLNESEVYVEQNVPPNDQWGENDNQNIEPFEDRNCNGLRDLAESENIGNDCPDYSSEDGTFCDKGNGQWDDKEILFGGQCSGEIGGFCYDYDKLFQRSQTPDQLIVNYENPESPVSFLEILPQGNFFDTGSDGCFDIFETGNADSPCVCEFIDYHNDILSCNDYLGPLLVDGNGDGFLDADLNMDGEITKFDIALTSVVGSILSLNGMSFDFGETPSIYNYGQCIDKFSGSKEDCCINNGCTWISDTCSFDSCDLDNDYWIINLDPNGDNGVTELDGVWQSDNEQSKSYYNPANMEVISVDTYYSDESLNSQLYVPYVKSPDYIVTKTLDYDDDFEKGGDQIQVIKHGFEIQNKIAYSSIIKSKNTIRSNEIIDQIDFDDSEDQSSISFYNSLLNDYHLVKTGFINSTGIADHDYIIFRDTDEHVIKMVHPYYHFLPGYYFPSDMNDFSSDDFWQSIHMESDTLLYSFNGNIIEGQTFHSFNSTISDTANYLVEKEYYVEKERADLKHEALDPNCIYLNESVCGNEDYYWCEWNDDLDLCGSNPITSVTDCLLVTRIITTTAVGPGMSYKLKSENYFKPGFGLVKEDISIYWDELPWVEVPWVPISSIQYKTPGVALSVNQSLGFLNRQRVNIDNFGNIDDFDYDEYKITNTFGLQRVEYPIGN